MQKTDKLLKEKENLMFQIADQLMAWDHTAEHALHLLKENNQHFKQMEQLDTELPKKQRQAFNDTYKEHWLDMIKKQQTLMQRVEEEKTRTQEQLAQIDQKQKVVANYISLKNKSIFIEKDY